MHQAKGLVYIITLLITSQTVLNNTKLVLSHRIDHISNKVHPLQSIDMMRITRKRDKTHGSPSHSAQTMSVLGSIY